MSGQLGELVISLSADLARFQTDMGKAAKIAETSAKDMAVSFDAIPAMFSKIGTAAAAVTAVLGGGAMFGGIINATKDVNGEVIKLSKAFGITAEDASIMRVALDDAFLTVDDAVGASDRLTRAALKSADAFERAGIETENADGSLKDSMTVMMEVNDYLKTLKEGKDRDTAAMSLYGKGWRELSGILKLTTEGMKEAKDRAEELHLIWGDDKIAAVKKYKLAMKDIDDVFESIKVQIGNDLIPELTNLAVTFGDTAVKGIPGFITGLHNVEAELMRMAMLADKAGGTLTTLGYYMTGGKFTDTGKWWKEQNEMYRKRYEDTEKQLQTLANLEVGLDANGNPIAKKPPKKPGKNYEPNDTDKELKDQQSIINAAHEAYLKYETAFEERKAAEVKASSAEAAEINKQAYETGLIDLKTYLDEKHRLNQTAIQAELTAKQNELASARKAETDAKAAYGADPSGDTAKLLNESYAKTEAAIKAVAEAQGKLTLAKLTDAAETKQSLKTELEDRIKISTAIYDSTIQIAKINGFDTSILEANKGIQVSKNKILMLENSIGNAKASELAVTQQQIAAENQILASKQRQAELDLRKGILNGSVSGLTGGYNSQGQWEYTASQRYSVANPYISDSSLMNGGGGNSNSVNNAATNNFNVTVQGGADAAQTGYNIAQAVRNGITAYQFNMIPNGGGFLP